MYTDTDSWTSTHPVGPIQWDAITLLVGKERRQVARLLPGWCWAWIRAMRADGREVGFVRIPGFGFGIATSTTHKVKVAPELSEILMVEQQV